MKLNLIIGWFMIIGGVLGAIYLLVLIIIGDSPVMVYARGFIIIPFAIWYGFRCLKKAKENTEGIENNT